MRQIPRIASPGFSLVEVTLALGIVTFGLIAVMGLLPTGLNLARQSADEAAAVNILTDISSRLESAGPGPIYFNADGMELSAAAGATYVATWEIRSNALPPTARITVGWPALAANSTGQVETIIVLSHNPQ